MDTIMISDLVKFSESDFIRLSQNKNLPMRTAIERLNLISFANARANAICWRFVKNFGND